MSTVSDWRAIATIPVADMTMGRLRAELQQRNLNTNGWRELLVSRLQHAQSLEKSQVGGAMAVTSKPKDELDLSRNKERIKPDLS